MAIVVSKVTALANVNSATVYTFNNADLGSGATDKFTVIGVGAAQGASPVAINNVTIAGVTAAQVTQVGHDAGASSTTGGLFIQSTTALTTGTVAVTFAGAGSINCGVTIFKMTGASGPNTQYRATDTVNIAWTEVGVTANGAIIAYSFVRASAFYTWGGVTERSEDLVEATLGTQSAAFDVYVTANTSVRVSAASTQTAAMILAIGSWAPSASGLTVIPVNANAIHSVASPALAQSNILVTVSPSVGHTVAAGKLVQQHTLPTVSGDQGHSIIAPALTRILIAVAATQGHTVAAGGLAQANTLVSVPGTQGHTADPTTLTKILLGVPGTQGHTVAAPGFTFAAASLIPVDASTGHTIGSPGLVQNAIVKMGNATDGHTVESPGLLQLNILPVTIDTQGHTVASPGLAQTNVLISVSPTASHTVAASALLQQNIQRVANAVAGHIADPARFPTTTIVTVVDSTTGHTAQVGIVQLFAVGQSLPSRTYAVLEDGRVYLVLPRNETIH